MQKILVIDDSRMIRMRVKDMLPSSNVEVVGARDGQEGLDLIHSQKPQLIILDFLLPKVSGWEVYQQIQNDSQLQGIPLVIMSGRKEEVTEKISEPFENFAFVEKPFEQEELVKAIKDAKAKVPQKPAVSEVEETETPSEPEQEEDVATLQAKVTNLEQQVETMQGQINQLNKRMTQLVNFIKKNLQR